jgi:hypothetical protein
VAASAIRPLASRVLRRLQAPEEQAHLASRPALASWVHPVRAVREQSRQLIQRTLQSAAKAAWNLGPFWSHHASS